jgi:hypothetical protein
VVKLVQLSTGATEEYDGSTWTTNLTALNTARYKLGGCWYTNSSFSFWWIYYFHLLQLGTGATEEYDGTTWTSSPPGLNTARKFSRLWNTNSSFRFWWWFPGAPTYVQEQQKNTMEQLGHQFSYWFKHSKTRISRCRNSNSSFSFWWLSCYLAGVTGATEEYNGTTWTTNPVSMNTARKKL